MHSYGNNFIILLNYKKNINIDFKKLGNFNSGIGYDQILIISKYINKKFLIKIFNNDNSEAKNCVNGLRCVAKYITKKIKVKNITFEVKKKKYKFYKKKNNYYYFLIKKNNKIKNFFIFKYNKFFFRNIKKNIQINFIIINQYFNTLLTGNDHVVFFNKDNKKKIIYYKKKIFEYFVRDFNLSFFDYEKKIISTIERGSGFTESCGSATISSFYLYCFFKKIKKIRLNTPYGSIIFFKKYFYTKGKCYYIYKGNYNE